MALIHVTVTHKPDDDTAEQLERIADAVEGIGDEMTALVSLLREERVPCPPPSPRIEIRGPARDRAPE